MDPALKHRLIGAAVLSALAIIFLPMLMVGRDVNDTASSVPLKVPVAPAGDFETKELPLVTPVPAAVPRGGVVGLDTSHPPAAASKVKAASSALDAGGSASLSSTTPMRVPAAGGAASPSSAVPLAANAASATSVQKPGPIAPAASGKSSAVASTVIVTPATLPNGVKPAVIVTKTVPATPPSTPVPPPPAAVASPQTTAAPAPAGPIPAANAGGHYVVSLGTYSNAANAQALVASLKARQLPAYSDAVTVGGKPATRVRIGPFPQRGDAETARLKAQQVRTDMPASVTALDAAVPAPPVVAPAASSPSSKTAAMPPVAKPATATAASSPRQAPPAAAASKATATAETASPASDSSRDAKPSPAAAGRGYAVQVSAFRSEDEALTLRNKLRGAGFVAFSEKIQAESGTLYRVRIGPEADRDAADHLRTELSAKLGLSGMVVAYP